MSKGNWPVKHSEEYKKRYMKEYRLGYIKPRLKRKKRKCLNCKAKFNSSGSGNRLCNTCRQSNHGKNDIYSETIYVRKNK